MVGHTGADVPKDIRRQVFFMDKCSQKRGTLGYGLKNRKGKRTKQVAEELYTINQIPETDVRYDDIDDEGIEIVFNGDGEEELAPQCQATTNSGDQCPNDAKHPEDEPIV